MADMEEITQINEKQNNQIGLNDYLNSLADIQAMYSKIKCAATIQKFAQMMEKGLKAIDPIQQGKIRKKAKKEIAEAKEKYGIQGKQLMDSFSKQQEVFEEQRQEAESRGILCGGELGIINEKIIRKKQSEEYINWKADYDFMVKSFKRLTKGKLKVGSKDYKEATQLSKLIKEAQKNSPIAGDLARRKELIEQFSKIKQEISEIDSKRDEAINIYEKQMRVVIESINKPVLVKNKQNVFQKMVGSIANRFVGKRREVENVVGFIGKCANMFGAISADIEQQVSEYIQSNNIIQPEITSRMPELVINRNRGERRSLMQIITDGFHKKHATIARIESEMPSLENEIAKRNDRNRMPSIEEEIGRRKIQRGSIMGPSMELA